MDRPHMQKVVSSFKIVAPVLLVLLLLASQMTPLSAQLTPARDLTGKWGSSIAGMYYSLDPTDASLRMNDVTAKFRMDITQQGNQIHIILYMDMISYVVDSAYWQEYGFAIPEVGGATIEFVGTVSSSSLTADEVNSQLTSEHLQGTFTTDIITATLTGNAEVTDTNGIVVTRQSSPTSTPTFGPTQVPTATPSSEPSLPSAEDLGSVSYVKAPAWFTSNGASVTDQSKIGTGVEVQTGSGGIVGFEYPDQGGTVYLGENSNAAWVYLQPQSDSTGKNKYVVVPPLGGDGTIPFEEGLEADELGQVAVTLPIEVAVAVLLLGETLPAAIVAGLVVEGVLLLPTGIAYIHESLSPNSGDCDVRPVMVRQGLVIGSGTDYVVTVSDSGTTIQVMEGSVIFVDRYTNDAITVITGQKLTLPTGVQTGFSQQELLSGVSAFNPSSVNQWWSPAAVDNSSSNILEQPEVLLALVLVIVVAITVPSVAIAKRKSKSKAQEQVSLTGAIEVGSGQPEGVNRKLNGRSAALTKKQLITQAFVSLVVFAVVGFILVSVFDYAFFTGSDFGFGIEDNVLFVTLIVALFAVGYVAQLVQSVRRYRKQVAVNPGFSSASPVVAKEPTYKMAAEPVLPTQPQQSMLSFCPNCGKQLVQSRNFCPICGFQLNMQNPENSNQNRQ